jgi:hypothetical protein
VSAQRHFIYLNLFDSDVKKVQIIIRKQIRGVCEDSSLYTLLIFLDVLPIAICLRGKGVREFRLHKSGVSVIAQAHNYVTQPLGSVSGERKHFVGCAMIFLAARRRAKQMFIFWCKTTERKRHGAGLNQQHAATRTP